MKAAFNTAGCARYSFWRIETTRAIKYLLTATIACQFLLTPFISAAVAQESVKDTRPSIAPDIREDQMKMKVQQGNFVVVPIPISNPTVGTGLVAGGAYFYPQTEQEKKVQPASLTAAAGLYTNNESRAFVVAQQNYWQNNSWRFTGAVGATDLRLPVVVPDDVGDTRSVDWSIKGNFLYARLSRKIRGNWYGGLFTRVIDANQSLAQETKSSDFDTGSVRAVGVGLATEFDSRDLPINSYTGQHFTFDALFNDEAIGSKQSYQSYNAAFTSYHALSKPIVIAWQLLACGRQGTIPLWDACRIALRGFPATDYLGKASYSGQVEARWRFSERWGAVAFVGSGEVGNSFSGFRENKSIPSFGAGLRFSVLPAKRINLRLDLAKSQDSEAIYFSVGEAF